ncbi:hypothetical protein EI42_05744 [Thermosporothrix hazakensis]|jgi:hypothetical protein|uniref:Uncharacterized protein n=1 Tax=Thermosporothrix hazakensis TaxID=644383 RepID=A0A326TX09_THEHA|nr:hypothetical protein [Thermosporothrix hazakensis]PZW20983.1 hypothetical protein EI42_05744 [Thermosporothrix hazakensis]GCE49266.1 hypothetical protein KTH_41350 [Thermosporothrix hazakensis]
MPTLDRDTVHRYAGLYCTFTWQDRGGDSAYVTATTIVGTLPEKVNGAPVYAVQVDGIAHSCFGYAYPMKETVKVYLQENGEPETDDATQEEVALAIQHEREKACQEYTSLMLLVQAGAYVEDPEDGTYWYEECNLSAAIQCLDQWALAQGLHFAPTPDGNGYQLEPATQEELDAYAQAVAEEDEEDEEA